MVVWRGLDGRIPWTKGFMRATRKSIRSRLFMKIFRSYHLAPFYWPTYCRCDFYCRFVPRCLHGFLKFLETMAADATLQNLD